MFEGFQIPDFKMDVGFAGPRAAHRARLAHADMHQLAASMQNHSEIPVTFDGQAPELAFSNQTPRLIVGERYVVPDAQGKEQHGTLTQAVVMDSGAMGIYSLDNGQSVIASTPLTEAELAAYKRHPDTFFGVDHKVSGSLKTPLNAFDFFMDGYRETPRQRLLELMANARDREQLAKLPREELLEIYAERCTYSFMQQANAGAVVSAVPQPPVPGPNVGGGE
jgi:hypothetical protein